MPQRKRHLALAARRNARPTQKLSISDPAPRIRSRPRGEDGRNVHAHIAAHALQLRSSDAARTVQLGSHFRPRSDLLPPRGGRRVRAHSPDVAPTACTTSSSEILRSAVGSGPAYANTPPNRGFALVVSNSTPVLVGCRRIDTVENLSSRRDVPEPRAPAGRSLRCDSTSRIDGDSIVVRPPRQRSFMTVVGTPTTHR